MSLRLAATRDANSDDGKTWRRILSGTPFKGRPVTLGLGDSDGKLPRPNAVTAKTKTAQTITLRAYNLWTVFFGGAGLLLVAAGLVTWGWNSAMLRDRAPAVAPLPVPFSLARVQMAWWLFLITSGFLFVWLTTGQVSGVLTPGVLTLIGISGTTGLAAKLIDPDPNLIPSRGFFTDILSDSTSIVLHRVQMFAWTVILGLIFLWTVAGGLTFPDFDPNLQVMAGIVNGVYLGFKFPEK